MKKPAHYRLEAGTGALKLSGGKIKLTLRKTLPDSDPAYALIGKVAAEWARIEHILDRTIWTLAGLDDMTGSCITTRIVGYRPRLSMIISLIKRHSLLDELIVEATERLSRLDKIGPKRNDYVHNSWYSEVIEGRAKTVQFHSFRSSEGQFGYKIVEPLNVKSVIDEIRDEARKLLLFQVRLSAELQSSRKGS